MKKAPIGLIFFIIMVLLTALSGCRQEQMTQESDTTIPVRVQEVKNASIQELVTATGTVYAIKEYALIAEQAGRYALQKNPRTGRPYVMGDAVAAGALLVSLDNPEYVNQIAMDSKKLSLESAEREHTKQQSVYEKGGITLKEVKDAEAAMINARYSYENAKLSLAKLEIRPPSRASSWNCPISPPGNG